MTYTEVLEKRAEPEKHMVMPSHVTLPACDKLKPEDFLSWMWSEFTKPQNNFFSAFSSSFYSNCTVVCIIASYSGAFLMERNGIEKDPGSCHVVGLCMLGTHWERQ